MLGRWGGANFLLKCHALYPICLTFLVVHFFTHIYYILILWYYQNEQSKQEIKDILVQFDRSLHASGRSPQVGVLYILVPLKNSQEI